MAINNPYQYLLDEQKAYFLNEVIHSTPEDRVRKLKKIKQWIFDNEEAIKEALYLDLNKCSTEAEITEIVPVLNELNIAIKKVKKWMSKKSVKRSVPFITVKSYIQASPKGNVLIISPRNFPFNLTLNPLISALSAGNVVIIKASEKSPHTTSLLKRMVNELFKEKEVALIEGDATVGRTLTDLPLNHIFFTGNEEIGKKVMKAAANNLCSTTLELGGANPVIIDKSSDLSDTAEKLVWGKFLNAGQSCLAPNHIFIDKEMKTNFIMELKAALMKLYPHPIDDFDLYHDFGRIINSDHCHKLVQLYEENKMDGVTILGGKYDIQKRYFSPTIIDDLKFESKFMTQEIFGPILGIYSYNDLDKVINYINTQSKPLCLYIFSKPKKNIETIKSKSQSGMICVNDTTIPFVVPNIPFGGRQYKWHR